MVTARQFESRNDFESDIVELSPRETELVLDELTRRTLGMTGAEFIYRYKTGIIDDPDRSDVICAAMLVPLLVA